MATVMMGQDNLPIRQRTWFHTPDEQVIIHSRVVCGGPREVRGSGGLCRLSLRLCLRRQRLQAGLGLLCVLGRGRLRADDAGLYGWDEEQMWPTIAAKLLKEHPELLPERLRTLKEKDPNVNIRIRSQSCRMSISRAWGDFIGNGYRGARACAASKGRTIKIWHYGSKGAR